MGGSCGTEDSRDNKDALLDSEAGKAPPSRMSMCGPVCGGPGGSQEVILEATTGPVIGYVTTSTARIMLEVNKSVEIICNLVLHSEAGADATPTTTKRKLMQANLPSMFIIDGLTANSKYMVTFVCPKEPALTHEACSFKTMPTEARHSHVNVQVGVISCNKISVMKALDPAADLWADLHQRVLAGDIQMLLHLGDQIYADEMMHDLADGKVSLDDGVDCKYMMALALIEGLPADQWDSHKDAILELYRDCYRETWGHPSTRAVLANCPNVMIMDDHEIRDDWGDHVDDRNPSSVDHYIARCGYQVFCEYQGQLYDDIEIFGDTFLKTKAHRIFTLNNHVGVLLADMRAARSFSDPIDDPQVVLGTRQWADIDAALSDDGALGQTDTLIFGAGVPLVFLNTKLTESLGNNVKKLDDMLGHWCSAAHKPEQSRLMQALDKWRMAKPGRDVIVLGGDVHVGGYSMIKKKVVKGGEVVSTEPFAFQFFSSSIGNAKFNKVVELGMRMMGGDLQTFKADDDVDDDFCFSHHHWTADRNYGLVNVTPHTLHGGLGHRFTCQLIHGDDEQITDGEFLNPIQIRMIAKQGACVGCGP